MSKETVHRKAINISLNIYKVKINQDDFHLFKPKLYLNKIVKIVLVELKNNLYILQLILICK